MPLVPNLGVDGAPRSGPPAAAQPDGRFQAALAVGNRRECLRAVRELHAGLRRESRPWALAASRVWLTSLVDESPATHRQLRRARRASEELLAAGRLDWACRALGQEGRLALLEERWELARALLSTACALGSGAKPPVPAFAWAALWSRRGRAHWYLGERSEARRAWETALRVARDAGLRETAAACHASLALCLWAAGEPAAGYVHSSTALNWYRAAGRTAEVAQILYNAALMVEDFGHWQDATLLLYEARAIALSTGDGARIADTSIELAHAYVTLGRLPDARRELVEARAASAPGRCRGAPDGRRKAELLVADAHIRLAQHRFDEALELLRRARALTGDVNRPILTRRVARHLNLAVQAGGGRLEIVAEMMATIRALTPSMALGPQSLLVHDADEEDDALPATGME